MSSIPDFSQIDFNELYKNSVKYQRKLEQNRKYVNEYQTKKRENKDENFLEKQRQYAKNYYEKNKEKVDKKNKERYFKKKSICP